MEGWGYLVTRSNEPLTETVSTLLKMTRTEQAKFTRDLCRSIEKTVIQNVKKTKETASWDGHELRVLLFEHFRAASYPSCITREPHTKRARDYRNVITCTNVL